MIGWRIGAVLVLSVPLHAYAQAPLGVDEAVVAALSSSPDTASATAAAATARAQLHQDAAFLDNPQLSGSFSLTPQKQTSAELIQPISLSGEGWHARAGDRAALRAAGALEDRQRLELAAATRGAWADARLSTLRTELSQEVLDLVTRLRESVERKVEVGEATNLEMRLAMLAEASAAGDLLASRRERDEAILTLVALTGISDPMVEGDPLAAAPPPSGVTSERQDVAALRESALEAERRLRQARASAVPRVGVGAFLQDDGVWSAGPVVSMELPLWTRGQAAVAEARGELQVSEKRAAQASVVADKEQELADGRARRAGELANLGSTSALEEARTALTQVETAYRSGELALSEALVLQRQVVEGEAGILALADEVVTARLDVLLAAQDMALLPEEAR